jgi:hypothetical protein
MFLIIHARQPLRKITANYTPRSVAALALAKDLSGDTQTDTLNRAVQMYAFLLHLRAEDRGGDKETVNHLLGVL